MTPNLRGTGKKENILQYFKKLLVRKSIDAPNPWVVTSTSWTNVKMAKATQSQICSAEFSSWTLFEKPDFEDDHFLAECFELFCRWTFSAEFGPFFCTIPSSDEKRMDEPDTQDSLLMAALLSCTDLLLPPSANLLSHLSCPDLVMNTPASLLFKKHDILTLPSPPQWLLESAEKDPPNSLVSTVSLPSDLDSLPDNQLSSFNLFSHHDIFPVPSIFNIDPTGVSSGSTVSVPQPFWDTVSTESSLFSTHLTSSESIDVYKQSRRFQDFDDEGYESDVDTTDLSRILKDSLFGITPTQSKVSRMMEECDEMIEKLVEMKKKLMKFI